MGGDHIVAFVWGQFGPYHMDRCEAAASGLGADVTVVGIEVAGRSDYYAWAETGAGRSFGKQTLFPGRSYNSTSWWARFVRLTRACLVSRARHVFLCHVSDVEYFLTALVLRLTGRRVYAMTESKFDDLPRRAWREALKKLFYLPYCGVLVGGARTRAYMAFLGFPKGSLAEGYDSISIERIRALAGAPPAPGGMPFAGRHFTAIARFVPKKNLVLLLDAYACYRATAGSAARDLVLCGSGPLEDELRAAASEGVHFAGFLQEEGVARTLAGTLALVLPSAEEQWGLVVNEALAMGVPVLVTDQVGARDSLVRTAVDGYVFEPDNVEGLAALLRRLAVDEDEWRRLAANTARFAERGDVTRFAEGVRALIGL